MGARHHDLGALGGAPHLDDVGLEPGVGLGPLVGHLLGLGQQRLDLAQVEQGVAAVALLDDAGDDVALAVGVLLELALALGLADALVHHLAEGLRGDAPEVARGVVAGVDPVALLVDVVGDDADVHGVRVDLDLGLVGRTGTALVGRHQGVGQHLEQRLDRDALLGGEEPDRFGHVDVAHDDCLPVRAGAGGGLLGATFAGLRRRLPEEDRAGPFDVGVGEPARAGLAAVDGDDRDAVVVGCAQGALGAPLALHVAVRADLDDGCRRRRWKCAGVRRVRSSPGLVTSSWYRPGMGSVWSSSREISRVASAMASMSTPPGRSTTTRRTPPACSRS